MADSSASSTTDDLDSGDVMLQVLTDCITTVLVQDQQYALCAMNTGLFARWDDLALSSSSSGSVTTDSSTTSLTALAALLETTTGSSWNEEAIGTCRLMCSKPVLSVSSSCCEATAALHSCQPTNEAIATCKAMFDQVFSYQTECNGISAGDIALIVVTAIIVCVMIAMVIVTQLFARKTTKQNDNDDHVNHILASRFAGVVTTKWQAFVRAWRQVMNLVWKNLRIRRRKPFALVAELFLPVLLVTGLLILANLDSVFSGSSNTTSEAARLTESIFCTDLVGLNGEDDLGAPNSTMTSFYTSGQSVLGLFFLISYIKFISTNTTAMVIEKENRIREVMKIMGLSDFTLLCSWCLTMAILSTPLAFAIAAELKYGLVFPTTGYTTLVFLFWALSVSIVSFSYCVTPFFNKSRTAAIVSVLVWLVLFFPFYAVQPKETNGAKYWSALSPPTAFALAIDDILRHAQLGTGFAYSFAIQESPITVPTAFEMSLFLLLDSFILVALGWYFEQVLPQEYGVRRPWNFCFKISYWWRQARQGDDMVTNLHGQHLSPLHTEMLAVATPLNGGSYSELVSNDRSGSHGDENQSQSTTNVTVEPVSDALSAQEQKGTCLQIRKLRKVFPLEDGEERIAVHDLDLSMYCGQITALLGHNGAGKTTIISMLTGLLPPTSGDATLFGRSIKRDFDELRQVIGVCPQHDVLFNDLTVEEHLRLFGTIKNVPSSQLDDQITSMIEAVGLTDKRDALSKSLSGGQKRKLSVALAFIGDSKLVFLDEPTSGMDPYSRRFTWNLLQKQRDDRVIVLTTHFMDEADILGDRIAIVADGQLCCVGSSLFLKNRFGAGYNLTLIKANASCNVEMVGSFLSNFVPNVKCLSSFGSEVVFQLPSSSSDVFGSMLQALDDAMQELHILQYGISVTTLEEVFLKIARDREEMMTKPISYLGRKPSIVSGQATTPKLSSPMLPYEPSFGAQYTALVTKRFQIAKRDKKTLLNSVCIPLLFLIILSVLPEIDVASFLTNYASGTPTAAQQSMCSAEDIADNQLNGTELSVCLGFRRFSYCDLGVIDCDAAQCCNAGYVDSPFYPCNTCVLSGTTTQAQALTTSTPCWTSKCMRKNDAKLQVTMNAFLVALVVMLSFAFIPASIVAFIVREKDPIQNAKSLQLICGANVSAYWLSSWTHDIVVTAVPVVAAMIIVPFSNNGLRGSAAEVFGVALLVISHVLTSIPLAYLFSRRFTKHAVAQTSLLVFSLGTGGLLSILSFLCRVIDFRLTGSLTLSALDRNYLRWIFLLFPGYTLNSGIYTIATRKLSRRSLYGSGRWIRSEPSFFGLFEGLGKASCMECWDSITPDCCIRQVFDLEIAGAPLIYAFLEVVILTALVFILENRMVIWKTRTGNEDVDVGELSLVDEDDDVAAERKNVYTQEHSAQDKNSAVYIRNVRHEYGKSPQTKVALRDLCLAIPKGECFGYLGINGAGKSTTMKVLTGQLAPMHGYVALGGYDLAVDQKKARTVIGYCPQFDSLHDLLTVEEQLALYARLKGIPKHQVKETVEQKIQQVGLMLYRDKLTRGLSGGNKRKVSTAIALMGSPQIVFLDEPTTGVDPSSRRKMWDVIAAVCSEQESCVMLTTHSMEECEALCTRVGILVSGELKCLGSVEHLKQKFGRGFTVEVKLSHPSTTAIENIQAQIVNILGTKALHQKVITAEQLITVGSAMVHTNRIERILAKEGTGWIIGSILNATGTLPLDMLCSWWAVEDQGEVVRKFFRDECQGSVLVEQQGDVFRFQVPKHSLRPFQLFQLLEAAKVRLHVSEYAVSDTSLEHIFNNMAAQQDEERNVPHGMQ